LRYRPIDRDPEDGRLGRLIPDDWGHYDNYPLSALAPEQRPRKRPVVIGVNWYTELFTPELDQASGEHWVAPGGPGDLTNVEGGHCVCLEPGGEPDKEEWWDFYDQGQEGACVGFGWSRCMTLLNNGSIYAPRWLWDRSKETDEWPETVPGDNNGTSVRSAGDILRESGHVSWDDSYGDDNHTERASYTADHDEGIARFRWARSVDEVHQVLGNDRADELGAVPILNSWGRGYPHRTWMPDEVMDRLMAEDGEIAIPTDR